MHARTRRSTVLVVALATISSLVLLNPASAQTPEEPAVPADPPPVADPPTDPLLRGQAAIDLLADKLDRQVLKYKQKLQDHHRGDRITHHIAD